LSLSGSGYIASGIGRIRILGFVLSKKYSRLN